MTCANPIHRAREDAPTPARRPTFMLGGFEPAVAAGRMAQRLEPAFFGTGGGVGGPTTIAGPLRPTSRTDDP